MSCNNCFREIKLKVFVRTNATFKVKIPQLPMRHQWERWYVRCSWSLRVCLLISIYFMLVYRSS